jgi:hypothetical protein
MDDELPHQVDALSPTDEDGNNRNNDGNNTDGE